MVKCTLHLRRHQSAVLIVGTLVCNKSQHTLFSVTLVAFPPWYSKPPFMADSPKVITPGHILVQHVVNKALTHQLAAKMIGGDPVHGGNHRHE